MLKGLIIKKYEASSILYKKRGIRDYYLEERNFLGNSLFLEYLLKNGLETHGIFNNETFDIVCMKFTSSLRCYKQEIKHWNDKIHKLKEVNPQSQMFEKFLQNANEKKELFPEHDIKCEDIRKEFYTTAIEIEHPTNETKSTKKPLKIKYRMLYRTAGKAKEGECYFINDSLYDKAIEFLRMGIKLPEGTENTVPIVQLSAYEALSTSTINMNVGFNGKIKINPKDILILRDIEGTFKTNVISIEERNSDNCNVSNAANYSDCIVRPINDYEIKTKLFDGQSLIDESLFPSNAIGFVTLRQHFFKTAAFNTNIQKFFMDYCERNNLDYENYSVKDMFGFEHKVKNIKLITTDDSCKWLKFKDYGVDYEYWCKKVEENENYFGIVKTGHPTRFGTDEQNGKKVPIQRMSYQMINSLESDSEFIDKLCQISKAYVVKLQNDNDFFIEYLENHKNTTKDYEVLIALCKQDPDFVFNEYFKYRKSKIIEKLKDSIIRDGKVLTHGDYLTIVSNPYTMLLSAVGEVPLIKDNVIDPSFRDETFNQPIPDNGKAIHCYSEIFEPNTYLAEFRNPYNSRNNLGFLYNVHHEFIKKYFNFGKQVIAVNLLGTDFAERNNGSDEDGDQILATSQQELIECAKIYYEKYPTIINNIKEENSKYNNSPENFAHIDNKIAASGLITGKATNLAQIIQTYTYNEEDGEKRKSLDLQVCILSSIAQLAIDSAKKSFFLNFSKVINEIEVVNDVKNRGKPDFLINFKVDKWNKNDEADNQKESVKALVCPMNSLKEIKFNKMNKTKTMSNKDFFVKFENKEKLDRRLLSKIEGYIEDFCTDQFQKIRTDKSIDYDAFDYKFYKLEEALKKEIRVDDYHWFFSQLIDRAFLITNAVKNNKAHKSTSEGNKKNRLKNNTDKNKAYLLKTLYDINPNVVLNCFSGNLRKNS